MRKAEESEYWRGVHNYQARQEWASLLAAYSWDAFVTATPSSSSLRAHPISLLGRVERSIRDTFAVSRAFIAAEQFQLGGWHCHGLVKWNLPCEALVTGVANYGLSERLSRTGFCRVESAISTAAVAEYVSKYVIKNTPWEYTIFGPSWRCIAGETPFTP